jgi:acyl-coenzyme A thioesterase PaaI-like protein
VAEPDSAGGARESTAPRTASTADAANASAGAAATTTEFDRDTAVAVIERIETGRRASGAVLAADVSPDWRAGRGPHGGYLAAMLLRALLVTVDDAARAPRSLTIHYARAPLPGPVSIRTTIERAGRSLSTLSARIEQDGTLVALALAAFSVPWPAPEVFDLPMPDVAPPDPLRQSGKLLFKGAPPFTQHLVLQPRIGVVPFQGASEPMEVGAWLGLAEPRPLDALSLAFLSDAMFSPPFIRIDGPATSPTIDLTIHFRAALPTYDVAGGASGSVAGEAAAQADEAERDPDELCFARFRSGRVHEGFFEEDGVIWGADGSLLAQSRQLAILMPLAKR